MKFLRLFITISFTKDKKKIISVDQMIMMNHSVNNTRMGLVCLFKCKSFNQFNPPELPQTLDICSVVVLQPNAIVRVLNTPFRK